MGPPVGLLCVLLCCYSAPYSSAFFLLGGPGVVAPVFPLPEGPLVGDSGLGGPGSLGPAFGKTAAGPGCSWILEQKFQKELRAQKEAGIEHFRSNLPPELLFRDDSEALSCVQSLLLSVTRADLQPVMFVDLSLVSDGQDGPDPGQGLGPDPGLLQRLDVVFAELGGLVHTWVLLMDDMKEAELYSDVHRIFRRHFTDDGTTTSTTHWDWGIYNLLGLGHLRPAGTGASTTHWDWGIYDSLGLGHLLYD
ncbi:unnamed protein product [Knipowitschia caucasica]|uniref:Uncharacterized protein n=1 Tax=Knipowitschia caucasica TaxID=637954 RepID=A0AAV2K0R9_KNICA